MPVIVKANPFRCRMWELHDRLEGHVNEHTCRAEIRSIASHGQLIPALARPMRGNPDFDYELIYGARRLFVTRHLNIEILLDVQHMSNEEALIAMDIENRHRRDISAYERGLSYARWLRCGIFASQDELARKLKNSPASVSRLLKLAGLPSVVISAFGDATTIRESWGIALADALENPESRGRIIVKARALSAAERKPAPEEVFRQLIAASAAGRRHRHSARDEVVTASSGEPLFRVKFQRQSVAFVLPIESASTHRIDRVRNAILHALQPEPRDS